MFAGGDIVTGGATVILAMGAGRRAARSIAAWLTERQGHWPVTKEQADGFVAADPPSPERGAGPTRRLPDDPRRPICPKCHRPIEGDEPYICCAGATVLVALRPAAAR